MKDWELLREELVSADEKIDHFGALAPMFEDYKSPLRKETEDELADTIESNQYILITDGVLTDEIVKKYPDFFERHGISTDLKGIVNLKKAELDYKQAQRALENPEKLYRTYPNKTMEFLSHCRETRKHIGRELRNARRALGYSVEEISEISGIDRGLISRLEAGRSNAGIDTVATLVRVYNIRLTIYG